MFLPKCSRGGYRLALALSLALLPAGCSQARRDDLPLNPEVRPADVCVTVFFADGMDSVRLGDLLERGALPNIRRHFVEGGVRVERAVASLPPITYPNAVSIITGRFPGHHGVLGNQWFDGEDCTLRDYGTAATYRAVNDDFACPTLYEILRDAFTVNVQGHTRRGVSATIDNWATAGMDWLVGDYSGADARVGACVGEVAALANRAGTWPAVYFNYFPGLDEVGHRHGSDSEEYESAMITVDAAIGRIIDRMVAAKTANRHYFILLSDHGHVPTPVSRHIDLADRLSASAGLRVHQGARQEGWQWWREKRLAGFDAVLVNGAFRRAAIHLRRGDLGWAASTAITEETRTLPASGAAVVGALSEIEGIAVVCHRDGPEAVRVITGRGVARIERREVGGVKTYRLVAAEAVGASPGAALGYADDGRLAEFVATGWRNSQAWLDATAHTDFPDFVPQVVEMFDSPRAGDVVAFADADWSFSADWPGGHGSCLARDMYVPLFVAGPGLPRGGVVATARLVDVVPTILDLLGESGSPAQAGAFDGISLLPALRSARRAGPG